MKTFFVYWARPTPTLNSSEGKVTHIIDRHVARPDNLGGHAGQISEEPKKKVGYNFPAKNLIYRPFLRTLLHIYRPTCYFTHLATNSGGLSWFFCHFANIWGPPRPPLATSLIIDTMIMKTLCRIRLLLKVLSQQFLWKGKGSDVEQGFSSFPF